MSISSPLALKPGGQTLTPQVGVVRHPIWAPTITVLGIGKSGCNCLKTLHNSALSAEPWLASLRCIAVGTDTGSIRDCPNSRTILIGEDITHGYGANGDPSFGYQAAVSSYHVLHEAISGSHLVILVGGLGRGTASGAAPVLAEIAKRRVGALTIGIFTQPFRHLGPIQMQQSRMALHTMHEYLDLRVELQNDYILSVLQQGRAPRPSYQLVNRVIRDMVSGLADVFLYRSRINLDLADLRACLPRPCRGVIWRMERRGNSCVENLLEELEHMPAIPQDSMRRARAACFQLAAGTFLTPSQMQLITTKLSAMVPAQALIRWGLATDPLNRRDSLSLVAITAEA